MVLVEDRPKISRSNKGKDSHFMDYDNPQSIKASIIPNQPTRILNAAQMVYI